MISGERIIKRALTKGELKKFSAFMGDIGAVLLDPEFMPLMQKVVTAARFIMLRETAKKATKSPYLTPEQLTAYAASEKPKKRAKVRK